MMPWHHQIINLNPQILLYTSHPINCICLISDICSDLIIISLFFFIIERKNNFLWIVSIGMIGQKSMFFHFYFHFLLFLYFSHFAFVKFVKLMTFYFRYRGIFFLYLNNSIIIFYLIRFNIELIF